MVAASSLRSAAARAALGALLALAGTVGAAPVVTVGTPAVTYTDGLETVGSMAIAPLGSIAVTADAGTTIASATACFDRAAIYVQFEESLVAPGAESLTPVGVTAAWDGSQIAAGGGCLTLTAGAGGVSPTAMAALLPQIRYLNGAPFGGPTTGLRHVRITVTDSLGAAGTGDVAITVRNAADRVCPVLVAQQAVDVLPTQLLGGAGVRVAASSTLTTANAALVMNVHARITGGCVPAQDALEVDYAGAPTVVGSQWFADTCDLTLYAAAGTTPANFQLALRNIVYKNRAAAGQATLGTRTITLSAGQTTPFECRSDGEVVTVALVGALPSSSVLPSPSESMTPLPTASLSPTPLGPIAGQGTPTEAAGSLAPETGGAAAHAVAAVAVGVAGAVAAVLAVA